MPRRQADRAALAKQVRDYFAAQPAAQRKILKRIRADIRAVVPAATDYMSYGIPAVRAGDKVVAWYAGFRKHVSIFPMGAAILAAAKVDASKYKTARGTIQFPIDEPPGSALVKRLVKARLAAMKKGEKV
jgi:uncharacterized protein YdhG (YjbR/CyaY superfamily)